MNLEKNMQVALSLRFLKNKSGQIVLYVCNKNIIIHYILLSTAEITFHERMKIDHYVIRVS
jgi:hypothetical protein